MWILENNLKDFQNKFLVFFWKNILKEFIELFLENNPGVLPAYLRSGRFIWGNRGIYFGGINRGFSEVSEIL